MLPNNARLLRRSATCPYLVLEVRRESLMQDTLAQLRSRKTQDLKKPLKIKYVGGGEEGMCEGINPGGDALVRRYFLA
jgi:hypothetical protein